MFDNKTCYSSSTSAACIGQICAFDRGVPVFNILALGELLNLVPRNLALKKLETSLYGTDILTDNYFILSQSTYLTDRQTERRQQ